MASRRLDAVELCAVPGALPSSLESGAPHGRESIHPPDANPPFDVEKFAQAVERITTEYGLFRDARHPAVEFPPEMERVDE